MNDADAVEIRQNGIWSWRGLSVKLSLTRRKGYLARNNASFFVCSSELFMLRLRELRQLSLSLLLKNVLDTAGIRFELRIWRFFIRRIQKELAIALRPAL